MEASNQPNEEQVSNYLRAHPQFFEQHAALLAEMYLPSSHGNGTVSLAERQQLAQRDKIRVLEVKLAELLRFGKENDAISDKVHRFSLGLLSIQNFNVLVQLLQHSLREDFNVSYVGIRLWVPPLMSDDAEHQAFQPIDAELKSWAQGLTTPYCGSKAGLDIADWFGAEATPKSFALAALRSEKVFGLLAMAAEDENRFYTDMGTLYVKRIGELVSAALLRHLNLEE